MGASSQPESRWLTWANGLTLLRLLSAPATAMAIVGEAHACALALFCFAVLSDLADGPIARRRGEVSVFGGLFDHTSDAIYVATGLAACAWHGLVPVALPALVLTSFAQYALDSRALAGRPLRASFIGRWNGVAYFVLLGVPVVSDGLALAWPPDAWVLWAGWLLVGSTVVSMVDRGVALLRK